MCFTASMISSKTIESWTFAVLIITASSGILFRSEAKLRLVPFSFIRRIRCYFSALLAGREAESRDARSQSIWLPLRGGPEKLGSAFPTIPTTSCHSFERRLQGISEQQPISFGSISQGKALFSTKTMPVRAARLPRCGVPRWGYEGSGSRSGPIISYSPSATSSLAVRSCYTIIRFVGLANEKVTAIEGTSALTSRWTMSRGSPSTLDRGIDLRTRARSLRVSAESTLTVLDPLPHPATHRVPGDVRDCNELVP
jgi:hypothetical protein